MKFLILPIRQPFHSMFRALSSPRFPCAVNPDPSTSVGLPPPQFPCAADLAMGNAPPGGRRGSHPPERCRSAVGTGGSAPVVALLLSIRVGDLRAGVHWVVRTPWVGDAVDSPAYQVVLVHNLAVVHSQGVHIRVEGVRTQVGDRAVRTLGGSN